jgi:hypothetical protein
MTKLRKDSDCVLSEDAAKVWATYTEARAELGVCDVTLWRMRRAGILKSRRYRGVVLILRKSIQKYLRDALKA